MLDFSVAILEQTRQLPKHTNTAVIQSMAVELAQMVDQRQAPDQVAALSAKLRHSLIASFDVIVVPRMAPNLPRARQLFSENCASCHDLTGQADSPLARTMEPAPTDFTDAERYGQRTLYGLYSTISAGVADTGMRGFTELSEVDRWSLAFLVGQMAVDPATANAGKAALADKGTVSELAALKRFTITTPQEAQLAYGEDGAAAMGYLRSQPEILFANASPWISRAIRL